MHNRRCGRSRLGNSLTGPSGRELGNGLGPRLCVYTASIQRPYSVHTVSIQPAYSVKQESQGSRISLALSRGELCPLLRETLCSVVRSGSGSAAVKRLSATTDEIRNFIRGTSSLACLTMVQPMRSLYSKPSVEANSWDSIGWLDWKTIHDVEISSGCVTAVNRCTRPAMAWIVSKLCGTSS